MNNEYELPVNPAESRVLESAPLNEENSGDESRGDGVSAASQFRHFYFGGLLYSVFYTFCLYRNANGITFPFFVGGTLWFFCSCIKKLGITAKKDSGFYVISLILLGISTFLTMSMPLIFMNGIGIFLLLFSFMIHCFYQDNKWSFSKRFISIFYVLCGAVSCIDRPFRDLIWYRRVKVSMEKNKKTAAVLIGILVTIPLLAVITGLLYQADAIFADFFNRAFERLETVPGDVFGIFFTLAFSFFSFYCIWVFLCRRTIKDDVINRRTVEPIIAIIFTGAVTCVYLVFCLIQIMYLFLGNIPLYGGFNYSSYAREGFFQLLFVCIINLVMVLICLGFFRENKVLKIFLTAITVCTYIMIASSALRMLLYIFFYNLTFLRVMVLCALFIIFLLITGVLIYIYKPEFPLFRYSVITVTVIYLVFSFSHPDYWIARYNLMPHFHAVHGQEQLIEASTDIRYLSRLSTDAAPALFAADSTFLQPENQIYLDRYINSHEDIVYNQGIRSFNLSAFIASGYFIDYRESVME